MVNFGLIGLGSMGSNLALNIEQKHPLHIHNRTSYKISETIKMSKKDNLIGHESIESLLYCMQSPRILITMLPHGEASMDMYTKLIPKLKKNDILLDFANEHYTMSIYRNFMCKDYNVNYLDVGISGGSNGALIGPALMVGGPQEVYNDVSSFLYSFSGNCVHVDNRVGYGHYAKMVHNGVEYGLLQGICDIYSYLNHDKNAMKKFINMTTNTDIDGYLTKSTMYVLDAYSVYNVSDVASMNNTGLWCSELGLKNDLGLHTLNTSVQTRIMSNTKERFNTQNINQTYDLNLAIQALTFLYAMCFYEGNKLLKHENMDIYKVHKSWEYSTIIQCGFVKKTDVELMKIMNTYASATRRLVSMCVQNGVPVPVLSAALESYEISHRTHNSTALLMCIRNNFGNHKMEYLD